MIKKMKEPRWVVFAAEVLVILAALIYALIVRVDITYNAGEMEPDNGALIQGGTLYADSSFTTNGCISLTPYIPLHYGVYKIEATYSAAGNYNMVYLTCPEIYNNGESMEGRYVTNTLILTPGLNKGTTEARVIKGQSDYQLAVFYMGDGSLSVDSIRIYTPWTAVFRLPVILLALFVFADGVYILFQKRKAGVVTEENLVISFALFGITIFASLPALLNYMVAGHDLAFHLMRIEGIREGLLAGDFPVKLHSNWLSGNGYAVSVFYGDALIYIPALFRMLGFDITESYNIYVVLINAATCLIAYGCFGRMFGSRRAACIGSAVYTLSLYRMINMYVRSAVGEYSAMTFLPLLVYGFWKVFTDDVRHKDYRKNWIPLVVAFWGIINTHILTCEISAAFIILLCLIEIKKVFCRQTFTVLFKTVVYTVILNIGFLLPFLQYMANGSYLVMDTGRFAGGIQKYGTLLGQLLVLFTTYGGLTADTTSGMAGEMPASAGLSVILGGLALLGIVGLGYVSDRKYKKMSGICLAFGALALFLSTHLFPWDTIQNMNVLFDKLVYAIQLPWRFLVVATIMLTVAVVLTLCHLEGKKSSAYKWLTAAFILLTMLQSGKLTSDIMNNTSPFAVYSEAGLDSSYVVGGEYLPFGIDTERVKHASVGTEGEVYITEQYRENNHIELTVTNNSDTEGTINTSLVYYMGYTARDASTGEELAVYSSEDCMLNIAVDAGYSGTIIVEFEGFWYWKAAMIISLLAGLVVVACIAGMDEKICNRMKKIKNFKKI